jgi:hypothetical protein
MQGLPDQAVRGGAAVKLNSRVKGAAFGVAARVSRDRRPWWARGPRIPLSGAAASRRYVVPARRERS